jgi:hypothetical protein
LSSLLRPNVVTSKYVYVKSNSSKGLQNEAFKTPLEAQLQKIEVKNLISTPVAICIQASILGGPS